MYKVYKEKQNIFSDNKYSMDGWTLKIINNVSGGTYPLSE